MELRYALCTSISFYSFIMSLLYARGTILLASDENDIRRNRFSKSYGKFENHINHVLTDRKSPSVLYIAGNHVTVVVQI